MPKGWWILPSVVCGSALWLWGGWAVYEAVQGSGSDVAVAEADVSKTAAPSQMAQNAEATVLAPGVRRGTLWP